jgi:hypothetical protein
LTTGYSLKKQLELLAFAFGIIVSLSLITIFAFPRYGTMQTGLAIGSWEGIYGHKNILGGIVIPNKNGILFQLKTLSQQENLVSI